MIGSRRGLLFPFEWGLLAAALILRCLYLLQVRDSPLFDVLLIDSAFYHRQALEIAGGQWLGDRVFFMAPLYSYVLGAFYFVFGSSWLAFAAVQSVAGALTIVLTHRLALRLFDPITARIAGVAAVLYPIFIFYDGALLTATLVTLFNLGALVLLSREEPRRRTLLAAGVLLGISALARANVLLFCLLALPALITASHGRPRLAFSRWLVMLAGVAVVLSPVVVRNVLVGREYVIVSANAGMNFYTGNNAQATGIYTSAPFLESAEPDFEREDFRKEASRRAGRELTLSESSDFWLGEGLRFIREQPGAYARLLLRKAYVLCNDVESQNNLSYYFARDFSLVLKALPLRFGWIGPLGLMGFLLFRSRRFAMVYAYVATYVLTSLIFFVSSEYRLPIVPVLMGMGAHFVLSSWRALRSPARGPWAAAAAVALVLVLGAHHETGFVKRLKWKRVDYLNFGTLYERQQNWAAAEDMFRQSLRIDPGYELARRSLASLYARQGRDREASALLEGLPGRSPLELGLAAYRAQEYAKAEELFLRALERGLGERARILNNLGLCAYRRQQHPAAQAYFRRAIDEDATYPRAHYNLALSLLASGEDEPARVSLERALELDPDYGPARRKLAELSAGN